MALTALAAIRVEGLFTFDNDSLRRRIWRGRRVRRPPRSRRGVLQELPCFRAGPKKFLDTLPQGGVTGAGAVQIRRALPDRQVPDSTKHNQLAIHRATHGNGHTLLSKAKSHSERRKKYGNSRLGRRKGA